MQFTKIPENATIIDVSMSLDAPKYHSSYMVLFDPTFDQVIKLAKASKDVFIFIFLTGPVDSQIDWSGLPKSNFIMQPHYLGCFKEDDVGTVVNAILENAFSRKPRPWQA